MIIEMRLRHDQPDVGSEDQRKIMDFIRELGYPVDFIDQWKCHDEAYYEGKLREKGYGVVDGYHATREREREAGK